MKKHIILKLLNKGVIFFLSKIEALIASGDLVFETEYDKNIDGTSYFDRERVSICIYKCPTLGYNAELQVRTEKWSDSNKKMVSLTYYTNAPFDGFECKQTDLITI